MLPHLLADRYELEQLLGQGGMGAVYQARDRVLGRLVAVKLLDVGQATSEGLERFRREAQILASLSHPHVVTMFDFGADDVNAWLVMELLPGPDVSRLVREQGRLSVSAALMLGQQVASALAYAHDAGVVHRDVKSANVMLAGEGQFKLLDLGIARLVGATTANRPSLTLTGTILGSVPFLAPEVISGQPSGPSADLYGLGAILFAALTGRPPFAGDTPDATLAQHLHAPPLRVGTERPDVPPELDELIDRLLDKVPADRPTAAECGAVCSALLSGRPAPTQVLSHVGLAAVHAAAEETRALTGPLPEPASPAEPAASLLTRVPRWVLLGCATATVVLLAVLLRSCGASDSIRTTGIPSPGTSNSASPTRTPRPGSKGLSQSEALAALSSSIDRAVTAGSLSGSDALDLQHRVSDMTHALAGGNTKDLVHSLRDFVSRFNDVRRQGHVSDAAYHQISSALDTLQSAATGNGRSAKPGVTSGDGQDSSD